MSKNQKTKYRRDHYLPQGYLRGFVDPSRINLPKPLWCFNLRTGKWKERAPKEVGYIDGFYDYATENNAAEHPDATFKYLENEFPRIRSSILNEGYPTWVNHKKFLLEYMQMIRARSPLFFDQWKEQAKTIRIATVREVLPDGRSVKVDSLDGRLLTQGETQDWTIARMREEMKKGPDWLANFNWAFRYTTSPADPVITAEQPLVSIGKNSNLAAAMSDPETFIYFPICWQAFLFGSNKRFDSETEEFHPDVLRRVRRAYLENGKHFLVSPQKIDVW